MKKIITIIAFSIAGSFYASAQDSPESLLVTEQLDNDKKSEVTFDSDESVTATYYNRLFNSIMSEYDFIDRIVLDESDHRIHVFYTTNATLSQVSAVLREFSITKYKYYPDSKTGE